MTTIHKSQRLIWKNIVMILMIIWAPLNVEKVSTKVPLSAISVPQNAQRISHYNRHIVELNLYSSSCKMLKSYILDMYAAGHVFCVSGDNNVRMSQS